MKDKNPIPIRAHHISQVKHIIGLDNYDITNYLMSLEDSKTKGYFGNRNHPFVLEFIALVEAFRKPESRFLIIDSRPDSICDSCPISNKKPCFRSIKDIIDQEGYVSPKYKTGDMIHAERNNLEIERVYSTQEILES